MNIKIFSKDKSEKRPVLEINCDIDLLVSEVKDKNIDVQDLVVAIRGVMEQINKAVLKGQRKAQEEADE